MREILFRGKRIDNGEWIEGSLSTEYYQNHGVVMISPSEDEIYKVAPSTVGQYTSLTDKNGKKIFEGDIVKVSSPTGSSYYAKIEYDCGCYWISNTDIQIPDTINNFNMEFVEVIGNIHDELLDNSELLEDKL